jgi:hypothetical protein
MIKLEITDSQFDTILAALWNAKAQASNTGTHVNDMYIGSPIVVELTNLMAKIGNQRDSQIRAEALLDYQLNG